MPLDMSIPDVCLVILPAEKVRRIMELNLLHSYICSYVTVP